MLSLSSALEHLSGVAARGLCDVRAREHSRDLFYAGATAQAFYPDFGSVAYDLLLHEQVAVCEARYLRLVRDA